MSNITWNETNFHIEQTKKPKKITGTKFAAILGKNKYTDEFETFCDITHAYDFPYEDNKYTMAGKTIEPIQANYMKELGYTVVTPDDVYGENAFNKTHGNFFEDEIFGGMWDYLEGSIESPTCVFEMKTTGESHRAEWDKDIPEYYALQAALYAYLLNVEKVRMVVSFLSEYDYIVSSKYKPDVSNTRVVEFNLHERYPDFETSYIQPAIEWWNKYVVTGDSPEIKKKHKKLIEDIKIAEEKKMQLNESNENAQLNVINNNIKDNVLEVESILEGVVSSYAAALDDLMSAIQEDVVAVDNPPIPVIERYFLELSNALYFISSKVERLGVYDGMSKLTMKEKFNEAFLNNKVGADGKNRTAAELTEVLSAPALKALRISSTVLMPPPTVKGINT